MPRNKIGPDRISGSRNRNPLQDSLRNVNSIDLSSASLRRVVLMQLGRFR